MADVVNSEVSIIIGSWGVTIKDKDLQKAQILAKEWYLKILAELKGTPNQIPALEEQTQQMPQRSRTALPQQRTYEQEDETEADTGYPEEQELPPQRQQMPPPRQLRQTPPPGVNTRPMGRNNPQAQGNY